MASHSPGLSQLREIIKAHEYTIKTLCEQKIADDAFAKDLLDRAVRVAEQRDDLLAALEATQTTLRYLMDSGMDLPSGVARQWVSNDAAIRKARG